MQVINKNKSMNF